MNDRKGEVDLIFENGKSPDRISHLKSRETYFAIYQSLEKIKVKSRFNNYIIIYSWDFQTSPFLKSFSSIQKKLFFSFLKFFFNPKAKCRQTPSFLHSRNFFFFNSNISFSNSQKFFLPEDILFSHFQKYFLRFKRCTKILSFSYSHYFHYFIFNLKKKIFFSFSNNFFNPKTKYI